MYVLFSGLFRCVSRCNLLQSLFLSDSFFLEQLQKSGYDAVERALSKVNMERCFIIVCWPLYMIGITTFGSSRPIRRDFERGF